MNLCELRDNWSGVPFQKNQFLERYDIEFSSFRNKKDLRILELGVKEGGSLELWSQYFNDIAFMVGVDIDLTPMYPDLRSRCYSGDLRFVHLYERDLKDPDTYEILRKFGGFDIIIDDASHRTDDIILSFNSLFPILNKGGLYCVENLCLTDDKIKNFVHQMVLDSNGLTDYGCDPDRMNYMCWWIRSVYFEEQLMIVKKDLWEKDGDVSIMHEKVVRDDSMLTQEAHLYHINKNKSV